MATALAVTFASLLLVSVLLSLWRRLSSLTLLDCFMLSIALFMGAYTIVDALTVEGDTRDSLVVCWMYMIVGVTTAILWLFRDARFVRATSFTGLREDWRACASWPVLALIALALFERWATAAYFSDINVSATPDLHALEGELPYWHTSIGHIVWLSGCAVAWCAWGKTRISTGLMRVFWLAATFLSVGVVFGWGRRALLSFLVIAGWEVISRVRRKGLAVLVIVASMPVLVMASNLYQVYRGMTHRGVVIEELVRDDVSITDALDVGRTVSNLQERPSMWRYNYEVMKAHFDGEGDLFWGGLFLSGLPSYIPAVLWPGKVVVETEDATIERFKLEPYDRGENIFVATYADFGVLSIVVAPALILLFVFVCSVVLRYLRDPFLRMLLLGAAIFYALNIENSYLVPLGIARDFLVVATLYLAVRAFVRLLHYGALIATAK